MLQTIRPSLLLFISLVCMTCGHSHMHAQSATPSEMTNPMLITFIQDHNIEEAYPHLLEVIKRIKEDPETNKQMQGLLAHAYYELARFHYNKFLETRDAQQGVDAISFGNELRDSFPDSGNASTTLQFEIHIHEINQEWELMRASLNAGLQGIAEKKYSRNLKFEWLESICYSYATEKKWKEGIPYFIDANEAPLSPTRLKTQSALYLIQAYEAISEPDKALPLLPNLRYAKEERYDPNLNFTLFKLGNQLSSKDEFSSANYMYFLCLTIEDIIAYNEKQLKQLYAYKSLQEQRNIEPTELDLRKIEQTEAYIASLKEQTSYTGPLKYQRAQNLERMGRKYDAYFAFLRLINEHPTHPSAQLFHYTAFNQADEIDYIEDALDLGERYLANDDYRTYRKEVVVKLVAQYFSVDRYDRVHSLGKEFLDEYPEHDYGNNIAHFMGFAWMRQNKIEESRAVLGKYLEAHPDAPLAQAANYWVGLGNVIEQNFEIAAKNFDQVVEKFPNGNFYIESRFRRAVCEFGIGDYDSARELFKQWVLDYPQHNLRGEAEVFLGDISAYYAEVPEALEHYSAVETYTQKINLIDHAYFESARLLEANERYQEIINLLSTYMENYQEVGNLTQAILHIGQAHESLGKPEVMVQSYYEAIVKFGDNPKAEGVDEIFVEFAGKYTKFQTYYSSTINFLDQLLTDEAFRIKMIDDRKALHIFRLKHPQIDSDLIDRLIRDQELRQGLGTRELPQTEEEVLAQMPIQYDTSILPAAKDALTAQLIDFQSRMDRMPKKSPAEQLQALYTSAKSKQQRTLELRLLAAFQQLSIKDVSSTEISIQDLPYASPATLAWIGQDYLTKNPALAELAIERVLVDHADSLAAPSAYYTKSMMVQNAGNLNGAIELLDYVRDRYPTWPKAPEVTLRAASIAMENNDYANALERYLEVLQVRDWRGTAWAEACFKIGQCYEATKETLKAHGFYERTYLSYRQFPEWAGKAYYHDGRLLEAMKNIESAKKVYEAYIALPNSDQLPDIDAVRKRYETL